MWLYNALFPYRIYLVAAGVAFLASLVLTSAARRVSLRLGIVDHPDAYRKLHGRAIPLGGGIAVLLAFVVSLFTVVALSASQRALLVENSGFLVAIVAASLMICAVGFLDDRFNLRVRHKLLGQCIAASLLIVSGVWIDGIQLFGVTVNLGLLAIPFTLFWLLGAVNSLNFIDGVDGLATSVGVVLSVALALLAMFTGKQTEAFMALAMAGALAGFLIYNCPPASIFLGDAGSMLIGLVLGALAIRASIKGPATVALAAPAAIWAIPILDVSMAILRRKLTGRSVYQTDRGHLHHTLLRRGMGGGRTVMFIGFLCGITAVAGVVSVYQHNEWVASSTVAAVFAVLIVSGIFGRRECLLLLRRTKHLATSFARLSRHPRGAQHRLEARLQGSHQWEELWETLTAFADRFDMSSLQLNIHLPAANEDYHATWRRREMPENARLWHSDVPLLANGVTVGRLSITGACQTGSVCQWIGELVAGLQPFETLLLDLVADLEKGAPQSKKSDTAPVRAGQEHDSSEQRLEAVTTTPEPPGHGRDG